MTSTARLPSLSAFFPAYNEERNVPVMVERMTAVLVQRKSGLVEHQERTARQREGERQSPAQSLGDRIRKFFGLS